MDTALLPQAYPVAITSGFVQKEEISIIMQCHDRIFNNVDIRDESGELLFTVETKGMASWSWRRVVKDVTGTPLFHFREHVSRDRTWTVESPSGREMCFFRPVSIWKAKGIDVVVWNLEDNNNEATLEVRAKDQHGFTTLVNFKGATVAEIQLTEENHSRHRDKSVWKARIAGGVDLAIIVAIMLCRAESRHAWGK